MDAQRIEFHINKLEQILNECRGQLNIYNNGKNQATRNAAGRKIDYSLVLAERHLEQYPEIIDFMADVASCDPVYLEYPEFHHIEKDTRMYLDALRKKLQELNQA